MSRGYTRRHAQTARDLGFAMQFNAETRSILHSSNSLGSNSPTVTIGRVTPFILHGELMSNTIAGHLRLPQPTPAPALMRVLHWLCSWAEETGYAFNNPSEEYGQIWGGCSLPLDDRCRVISYNAVQHSTDRTDPQWPSKDGREKYYY